MDTTASSFGCGIPFAESRDFPAPAPLPARTRLDRRAPGPSPVSANPLERLAQLMLSNERLMDDLAASRSRIAEARAYLDTPDSRARFGEAHLERCRVKHSGILAQLRANRIEALDLLGRADSGR